MVIRTFGICVRCASTFCSSVHDVVWFAVCTCVCTHCKCVVSWPHNIFHVLCVRVAIWLFCAFVTLFVVNIMYLYMLPIPTYDWKHTSGVTLCVAQIYAMINVTTYAYVCMLVVSMAQWLTLHPCWAVSNSILLDNSLKLSVQPEVQEALLSGRPVVALETAIITHGMPYPRSLEWVMYHCLCPHLPRSEGWIVNS